MKANFYEMFPEYRFAIVKLQSERLSFNELKRINHAYKSDVNYSNISSLIVVIDEKSKLKFSVKDLSKLSDLYNTEPQTNNHKIVVWLVSQPLISAITDLFVLRTKDNSKYCSTVEKAYELLGRPIEFEKFRELIEKTN